MTRRLKRDAFRPCIVATSLLFLSAACFFACNHEVEETRTGLGGISLDTPDGISAPFPDFQPAQVRLRVHGNECYSSGCYEVVETTCDIVSEGSGRVEVAAEFRVLVTDGNGWRPGGVCAGDCTRVSADCGLIDRPEDLLVVFGQDGERFEAEFPLELPWYSGW